MTTRGRSPILGVEVLSAPLRAQRPGAFGAVAGALCPFCPGNEAETPPAVLQQPATGPWDLRVVPNRYPLIGPATDAIHEVLIESPRHSDSPTSWDWSRTRRVVALWLERMEALRSREDVAIALMFRNEGAAAGASLEHPHSQIIGLSDVPPAQGSRFESVCPICADLAAAPAVLAQTDGLMAWCPAPSVTPWEVAISSTGHQPLAPSDEQSVDAVTSLLRATLGAWGRRGIIAGNLILQEGRGPGDPAFHWSLSLHPRVSGIAGFELATGIFVNVVPPDRAAEELRRYFSAIAPSDR